MRPRGVSSPSDVTGGPERGANSGTPAAGGPVARGPAQSAGRHAAGGERAASRSRQWRAAGLQGSGPAVRPTRVVPGGVRRRKRRRARRDRRSPAGPGEEPPGRLQGWTRRERAAGGRREAASPAVRRRGDGRWARFEQVRTGGSEPLPPYLGDAQRGKEGTMRDDPRNPSIASAREARSGPVIEVAAGREGWRTRGAGRALRPRTARSELRVHAGL